MESSLVKRLIWNLRSTLFNSLNDNKTHNIVVSEFDEDGVISLDFSATVEKKDKFMHVDSQLQDFTHWMFLNDLIVYLERLYKGQKQS